MSLNEIAEVLRDLLQRLKSMSLAFPREDENSLQGLRELIAPHDDWRQQSWKDLPYFPLRRLGGTTNEPMIPIRVWSTSGPVHRIQEL